MSKTELKGRCVGLYGGSFNPPHVAHVLAVGWALSAGGVDEVWIIPTGGHPFGKVLAPFEERLTMCRLAFACFGDRVKVLDIERGPEVHYSVDTVERLAREFPEMKWRWIIGSDAMSQSSEWKNFARLAEMAPPLVIGRQGYAGSGGVIQLPNISSTILREKLASQRKSDDMDGLLPFSVLDYIRRKSLYTHADPTIVD